MDHLYSNNVRQRLLSRREKIASILRNLEIQKMDISKKTPDHYEMMKPSRSSLLDCLDGWYHKELNDVDNALARARLNSFGICLGCQSEIDSNWLEKCPEAEFCRSCEDLKKWMELG
jgi:RNA polymerase-binding transcription factor DksA